eukprot:TRINITY_DN66816_c8_g2_i5.p1 TRINITY_DN66816_c8_g2~~TRINITY_DN66816_c8_g2_i5.p1  ORF type:complete len:647 (+),score=305.69 TRINITY_DN66816_c8_g2_i5:77-2017(+)
MTPRASRRTLTTTITPMLLPQETATTTTTTTRSTTKQSRSRCRRRLRRLRRASLNRSSGSNNNSNNNNNNNNNIHQHNGGDDDGLEDGVGAMRVVTKGGRAANLRELSLSRPQLRGRPFDGEVELPRRADSVPLEQRRRQSSVGGGKENAMAQAIGAGLAGDRIELTDAVAGAGSGGNNSSSNSNSKHARNDGSVWVSSSSSSSDDETSQLIRRGGGGAQQSEKRRRKRRKKRRYYAGQRMHSAKDLAKLAMRDDDLNKLAPPLKQYYKNQNRIIQGLLEMHYLQQHHHANDEDDVSRSGSISDDGDAKHNDGTAADSGASGANMADKDAHGGAVAASSGSGPHPSSPDHPRVMQAVQVSFAVNVLLFVLKVMASVASGSLSVIASTLDSLLDLLSGSILYFISVAMKKPDPYRYPVSKSRLEPVGIIVFAAVMGMTSLHILEDAMESIVHGLLGDVETISMNAFSIMTLLSTIVAKFALYLFCRSSESDMVAALAQDHQNDMATNSLALVAAMIAAEFRTMWFFDAIGAMLLSAYIMVSWVQAGKEQIGMLVGKSASPQLIGQLAYLAAHHDRRILRVDKVLAYHFGSRYMCEVDIVLPEDMRLKKTHDIGESLEIKIEKLAVVERAFVHIDYEWTHKAEHTSYY